MSVNQINVAGSTCSYCRSLLKICRLWPAQSFKSYNSFIGQSTLVSYSFSVAYLSHSFSSFLRELSHQFHRSIDVQQIDVCENFIITSSLNYTILFFFTGFNFFAILFLATYVVCCQRRIFNRNGRETSFTNCKQSHGIE